MTYPSKEFDDAVAAILAGTATEAEARAVGILLRAEKAARTAYLWQTELHARLYTREESARDLVPLPPQRLFPGAWLALAACVALFAAGIWWSERQPAQVFQSVKAEVVETTGGNRFSIGQKLDITELKFLKGNLRLRLESGVLLECEAPLDARFETIERLHLRRGRMNVDVGERGVGFTIVTTEGDVVDLGTQFGIEAGEDGAVKVAVFSGAVEVRPKQSRTVNLTQGDAARFKRQGGIKRVQSVSLVQHDKEVRLQLQAPHHSLIGEVSDNLSPHLTNRFYGVVSGGMRERAKAFVDRPAPLWKALPNQKFPAELEGADLIQTFQDLRWFSNFALRVKINQPSVLYVLHDPRNPPPNWLKRDYEKAQMVLNASSWSPADVTKGLQAMPNGRFQISFEVWKREVPSPMTIELGPPYEGEPEVPSAMYGIAVKAR